MVETSTRAGTGEDLYDWLGLLRDGAPVRRIQGANGLEYWLVTRHSEAASVLADRRRAEEALRQTDMLESTDDTGVQLGPNMLRTDPPDHTRLRGLVSAAFTPRRIGALRPRIHGQVALKASGVSPRAVRAA
jgi:cytochrome P450